MSKRGVTFFASLFAGAIFAGVGFAATLPHGLTQQTVATVTPGAVIPVAILQLAALGMAWPVPVALALLAMAVTILGFALPEVRKPTVEASRITPPSEYEWVTLRGQIVWPKNREITKPAALNVTTDRPTCCANDEPLLSNQLLIDPKSRGIKNVVVWLMPEPGAARRVHPKFTDSPLTLHEIDQPECQFEPRVIAARAGDSLLVKNSANIAHNVQVMGAGLEYNRTLPASKSEEKGPLVAEPKPVPIVCNVHPWMKANLWVFDHPHFAVTDAEGRFEIPNVPVGSQRLVIWHELGYDGGPSGKNGVILTVDGTDPVYHWPTWALQLGK
jgi:plastocyanin